MDNNSKKTKILNKKEDSPQYQDGKLRFAVSKVKAAKVDSTIKVKKDNPIKLNISSEVKQRITTVTPAPVLNSENFSLSNLPNSNLAKRRLVNNKNNQSKKVTQAMSADFKTNHSLNTLTKVFLPTAGALLNTLSVPMNSDKHHQ